MEGLLIAPGKSGLSNFVSAGINLKFSIFLIIFREYL